MKKILIGLFLILFILGVGGFFFLDHLHDGDLSQKEKEQVINRMLGRVAVLTQSQHPTDWTVYHGVFITFSYPSWAKIYTTKKSPVAPDLFSFGLLDEHLAFTIESHPSVVNFTDLSSFEVRKNSNDYKVNNAIFDKNNCSGFERLENGVEESLFCIKNGRGIVFVGSGPDKESILKYLEKIVNSASF